MLKTVLTHGLALGLALIVWVYAYESTTRKITVEVPVDVKVPAGWIWLQVKDPATHQTRTTVSVTMQGNEVLLSTLDLKKIRWVYTLSEKEITRSTIDVTAQGFSLPAGVSVLRIFPSTLQIRVDRLVSKTVSVTPITQISLKKGYEISQVSVTPSVLTVRGPQAVMASLSAIETEPILLTDPVERSFSILIRPVSQIQGLPLFSDKDVKVTVDIVLKEVEKTFKVPVTLLTQSTFSFQTTLLPDTIDVQIKGKPKAVGEVTESMVKAFVDLRQADSLQTNNNLPVEVVVDHPHVQVERETPDKIVVQLEK